MTLINHPTGGFRSGNPGLITGLLKRLAFCNHLKRGFFNKIKGHLHLQVAMFRCTMHPDPCSISFPTERKKMFRWQAETWTRENAGAGSGAWLG